MHRVRHAVVALAAASSALLAATAVTVEDERLDGELIALDATPAATLRIGGKPRRIPCADLLALELRPGSPAPDRTHAALVLRDGRALRGILRGGSSRAAALDSPALGSLDCPLAAIARIEFPVPQPPRPLEPAAKHDRLLLLNGDVVDGTVQAFGAKGVRFRSELLGELEIGYERLTALAFAAHSGAAPPAPKGVFAIVHADDGTVVAGKLQPLADGKLQLRALFGPTLAVDLQRVLRIEFRGGRLVYLSDLKPIEVKETPFFDLVWHYRRDRSVDGNPLRLGQRTYRKGLGVHSRCQLTWAIDGAYRRFRADVGIDGEVVRRGDEGNVDVAVLVDGKVRFERKGVTGRDGPIPVAIDIQGATRLSLVVDFGRDFDICDHADWANARLIR